MQYYTKESPIILKEYGKLIQGYVHYAMKEVDKEKRTKIAYAIIDFMSQLTPQVKATVDYRRKLWDHLFFIADYKLDIDAPYDIAEKEFIVPTPTKLDYPKDDMKQKHYGKYIVEFIEQAAEFEEVKRKVLSKPIAAYMKLVHKTWNNEVVNDSIVKNDLHRISKGALLIADDEHIKQLLPTRNNKISSNQGHNKNKKKKFKKPFQKQK